MHSSGVLVLVLTSTIIQTASQIVPLHYDLTIEPHFHNLTLVGQVNINVNVERESSVIVLNAKSLEIISVSVTKDSLDITDVQYALDDKQEALEITFDANLEIGLYDVKIEFTGIISKNLEGFYISSYKAAEDDERIFALANLYGSKARQVFPCFDSPEHLSTFSLNIVRLKGQTSIANGAKISEDPYHYDKMLDSFAKTDLMPVHHLSFAIIDFPMVTTGKFSVYNFKGQDADKMLTLSTTITDQINQLHNLKINKIDQIIVPDHALQYNAISSPGIIVYRASAVLHTDSMMSSDEKQQLLTTMTLAFSRQYFTSYEDGWQTWYTEGGIRLHQLEVMMSIEPQWRIDEQFIVESVAQILAKEEINSFELETGLKNNAMLEMLEEDYGLSIKAVSLLNMLKHYERPADAAIIEGTMIQYDWAELPGYPLVSIKRDYTNNKLKITQQSNTEDNNPKTWSVPLNFASRENATFEDATFTYILESSEDEIETDADSSSWIIADKQRRGYYRLNYDDANWQLIIEHLKSDNFETIHPINRAQLIDDAFSLAKYRHLNVTTYLELIGYIDRETDYIPLLSFFSSIAKMKTLLSKTDPDVQGLFQIYIHNLLKNQFEDVGVNIKPNEPHLDRLKRNKVLNTLCRLDHEECQREMFAVLDAHLVPHPDMQESVYCGGMYMGEISHYMQIYSQYTQLEKRRILKGLSCTNNVEILREFLAGILDQSEFGIFIKPSDKLYAVLSVIEASDVGVDMVIEFLKTKSDEIFDKLPLKDITKILLKVSENVLTEDQESEIIDYINCLPDDQKLLLATTLVEVNNNVKENVAWFKNGIDDIANWLRAEISTTSTTTTTTTSTTTTTTPPTTTTNPTTTPSPSDEGPTPVPDSSTPNQYNFAVFLLSLAMCVFCNYINA